MTNTTTTSSKIIIPKTTTTTTTGNSFSIVPTTAAAPYSGHTISVNPNGQITWVPSQVDYNGLFDPVGPTTLVQAVAKLEEDYKELKTEYFEVRKQIIALRMLLGMGEPPQGTVIKMSTALMEIITQISKHQDLTCDINKEICL